MWLSNITTDEMDDCCDEIYKTSPLSAAGHNLIPTLTASNVWPISNIMNPYQTGCDKNLHGDIEFTMHCDTLN